MTARPTDQDARDAIRTDVNVNMFVVAGAGSGKTSSLVARIAELVLHHGVSMTEIAAVTFTEKAGAELRDRLRASCETAAADERRDAHERSRARQALVDLDGSAIGTLHSFAQRLLELHPIEAKLPPKVDILDEVGSSIAMDDEWVRIVTEMLDDDALRPALSVLLDCEVKIDSLQSIVKSLAGDWDLIDSHILAHPEPTIAMPDLAGILAASRYLTGHLAHCTEEKGPLRKELLAVADWSADLAELLASLGNDSDEVATMRAVLPSFDRLLAGTKSLQHPDGRWKYENQNRTEGLRWAAAPGGFTGVRDEYEQFRQTVASSRGAVLDSALRLVTRWLAVKVLAAAETRRAAGSLMFHDLLVLARELLRRDAAVCDALSARFPRLMLDEFQDTDPIQIEIAVRIAGGSAGQDERDWRDIVVPPGALFVVGDPKQSIYRFRRANVGLYLEVGDWFTQSNVGGRVVSLTTNFRSAPGVLSWVNHVFAELITYQPGEQPAYEDLVPARDALAAPPSTPVTVLGATAHGEVGDKTKAAEVRTFEAADVAAVIGRALDEGWQVRDGDSSRRVRCSDIAVLVPARTSLPFLREALDQAGIPYRAEASSLVYESEEVVDLLMAVQAIADPTDHFAVAMTLRSPLFGLGDDDLWTWRQARGNFSVVAKENENVDLRTEPAYEAMTYLRSLSRDARRLTPAEVLDRLIRDRVVFEVAATEPDATDRWRRLRFVVDQARAWSENARGGLRSYLGWARLQSSETARVYESILPESDVDAVRVLTIHAAKGLEFPMVVVSGLSALHRNMPGVQLLWDHPNESFAIRASKDISTTDFETLQPIDEQMGAAERRRLLYVAATRAKDILAVSAHRAARKPPEHPTNAELIADVPGAVAEPLATSFDAGEATHFATAQTPELVPIETRAQLTERLARVQKASARHPSITPSGLEGTDPQVVLADAEGDSSSVPLVAKAKRDLDSAAWNKGRDANRVGTAVHAVLQSIDLRTGGGLAELVAIQCVANDVVGHEQLVGELVQRALDHEVVQAAAHSDHWRESLLTYLDDDGTIVEGYADLIYRDEAGDLHIIDYKTDALSSDDDLASRAALYAPQLAKYAEALAAASGQRVVRSVPLFLDAATAQAGQSL